MTPSFDHYTNIYTSKATRYHEMIAAEDVDGNLLPAINKVAPLANSHLLDLGSGTGRISLLFQQYKVQVSALDLHASMLRQQAKLQGRLEVNWPLLQADIRQIPYSSNHFDIVTAGWAIGHFLSWYGSEANSQIKRVLSEMKRVCKPGGVLIILETLSTGSHVPIPPTNKLAQYYDWLETEWGFARQEIQTDYQFRSIEEAITKTEFFFGKELSDKIRKNNWARLPEWTGVWSKSVFAVGGGP